MRAPTRKTVARSIRLRAHAPRSAQDDARGRTQHIPTAFLPVENPSVFAVLSSSSFLPVVISSFSPSSLRRRKQSLHSVTAACDLAKRWSRLAVAREAAGIHKGRQSLMHVFFRLFLCRVTKKWAYQTIVRNLC